MNKNHLLPALLFVLAACGGTTASSSTPASSSAFVDNSDYRLVGSSQALSSWTPANALVMARTTGTNIFSYTLDLYVDDQWKIVIGADWNVGTVSAKTPGISIVDKGETWAKDEASEFIVPAGANTITVDDNNGGLNFETVVNGNYTITLLSSTPLSKTLTILRNGDPIVPPVLIKSYSLVGEATLAGWNNNADGFELTYNSTTGEYTFEDLVLTAGLFRILETGTWGGNIGFSKLSAPVTGFTAGDNDDNILVGVDGVGTYDVKLVFVNTVAELTFTKVS
jgi:hypothetical protein